MNDLDSPSLKTDSPRRMLKSYRYIVGTRHGRLVSRATEWQLPHHYIQTYEKSGNDPCQP